MSRAFSVRIARIVLIAVVVSGCATTRALDPSAQKRSEALWRDREARLGAIDRFTLNARVASGRLGFKADLRWKQQPDGRYSMRMSGPFGAGAALFEGDAQQVRVRTSEGETYTADPEAWLEARFGWRLPVSGLRWWALGLPSPNAPFEIELDADGRAARIVQNGWELAYAEYAAVGDLVLPRRIEARNGETEVRLFADRWDNIAIPDPSRSSP